MAQQSKTHHNNGGSYSSSLTHRQQQEDKSKLTMFHDFLGIKKPTTASDFASKPTTAGGDGSSVAAAESSGGGREPISTTSDLGSERQVVSHLEGVPYYGPRSDITGSELSKKLVGSKRSNSDCTFIGSYRDTFPQMGHDPLENLHFMKMLRNGTAGDRPKRPHDDDEVLLNVRPTSSLVIHPPGGSRIDPNASKWERAIGMNAGQAMHYPPRGGQFAPFVHQVPHNRFRDANAGPLIISQLAADEGSRTGMKGLGILSSLAGVAEKNVSGLLPSGSKPKSGTHNEPESFTPPGRQGLTMSRQMTIFYGGQAHVFDDVHPNKADIIMTLAGSNGGSWSTTLKSTAKPGSEGQTPSGDYEAGVAGNTAIPPEFRGRLSAIGSIGHGVGSNDRVSTPKGAYQGGVIIGKDMTRYPVLAGEPRTTEEKRDMGMNERTS